MKLKDKTYKKFIDFFSEMSKKNQNEEFEIAFSEIQRETGVASITLKKAIQILAEDSIIQTRPGRNSRYIKVLYLKASDLAEAEENISLLGKDSSEGVNEDSSVTQTQELLILTDQLRQRIRILEMSLATLQERLANLEDKVY